MMCNQFAKVHDVYLLQIAKKWISLDVSLWCIKDIALKINERCCERLPLISSMTYKLG